MKTGAIKIIDKLLRVDEEISNGTDYYCLMKTKKIVDKPSTYKESFLKDLYDIGNDKKISSISKSIVSIINSIITQNRLYFTISRRTLFSLIRNDVNWKKTSISNESYKIILKKITETICVEVDQSVVQNAVHNFSNALNSPIYKVIDEELLKIIDADEEMQFSEVFDFVNKNKKKKNRTSKTDHISDQHSDHKMDQVYSSKYIVESNKKKEDEKNEEHKKEVYLKNKQEVINESIEDSYVESDFNDEHEINENKVDNIDEDIKIANFWNFINKDKRTYTDEELFELISPTKTLTPSKEREFIKLFKIFTQDINERLDRISNIEPTPEGEAYRVSRTDVISNLFSRLQTWSADYSEDIVIKELTKNLEFINNMIRKANLPDFNDEKWKLVPNERKEYIVNNFVAKKINLKCLNFLQKT